MSSNLDDAWAAGLVDGDGCLSMVRNKSSMFGKPIVVVDNTDIELLAVLVTLYGGSLVAKKRYQDHHRQAHSWRLYGSRNVAAFLVKIYPYMRCAMKRERARMFIEEYPLLTQRNGYYTDDQRILKQEFEGRFMALGNGRGKRALVSVVPVPAAS